MNKKFTKLLAALALLVFMTPTMAGWGQTRETLSLTFPLTSSPGGWPTTNPTTLTNYTYSLEGVNYTFALKNVKCNSGYLMMTSTAVLGLPAIDGYKLTTVVASNSSGCSTSTKVGISNSATQANYISGGAIQTWSTTSSSYTYNLTSTEANTMYYMYVTNKNAQVVELALTYESTGGTPSPSMSVSTNSIDFGSNNTINPSEPYTETFEVTFANLTENLTVTGFTGVTVSPATINYNATSPQTVTVSYNPTAAGSISGNISVNSSEVTEALVAVTGSAYDPANVDTYELYTGEIVEGDYVIYNTHGAMKNELNGGPRFNNESVTISGDIITNPANSVIWHIAPIENTEYWTIYNAAINKYAGGTTSKNQGALYDDYTDNHAKWKIYYSYSTLYIENLGRSQDASDSGNKYLRQNSTASAGWATYANSNSYVPMLYKKVIANQVAKPSFSVAEGTYYETQSISLSCATDGATIYYTTDGSTPSASNGTEYTTVISVSTTTTIKAIAVKSGMADSDVATATYTIEQPYSTIPALFAAATATEQDVRVTFGNWVVSGVSTNGKSVYVTDNSGNGFIIYFTSDMSSTFSAGKILSGTAVACKLKLYYGAAELVNLNASDLTITDGGTVSTVNIAMANLSGVNTGALVHYDNLTCTLNNNKCNLSDGTTTLQAYNTLYDFNEFVNGKIYNVTGVYVQYNSTKQIAPRSTNDIVEVIEEYTLTVTASANVAIFTFVDPNEQGVEGSTTLQVNSGTEVGLSVSATEGYLLTLVVDGTDVTSQLDESGYFTFTMPTHDVTVTATAELAPLYTVVLCDDNTDLTEASYGAGVTLPTRNGDETYTFAGWSTTNVEIETTTAPTIIPAGLYHPTQNIALYPVYTRTDGTSTTITEWHLTELADADAGVYALLTENYYAFNGTINNSGHGEATSGYFTFVDGVATSAPANTLEMTFEAVENNGTIVGYKMYAAAKGYLYAKKASSGNLAWISTDNQYWSYQELQAGNWCYSQNSAYLRSYSDISFRTYGNNSGNVLKLAKKVEASASTTYYTSLLSSITMQIAAEQWYLIASPVGSVNPIAVGSMIGDQYGLYSFDQTGGDDGKEWRNYKAGAFNQLQAGTGYLYINHDGCTLTFTGTPYNGEGTFPLFYSDVNETETFHGLNLLGNPYAQSAAIDHDYYIMNANGTDLTPYTISDIVPAMQGVFVQVTEEGQSVTFTPSQSTTGGKGIEINLTQNRGAIVDRAIVRFGEGRQLSKVQLFDNSTKLYIPQNGKDYAIVSTEAQGELPVNFSASENGTYTLSMDVKNMDVNYLHLIDNMTGMDVDLLQTPSYTFEATTTDYESRFRLVFASNNANTDSDNFAFFSNGNLIINNEGNATLQVIDLNGRILSSESVNGSVSTTLNATPGVYMLRLINGENVKVQKIVVR